MDNQTLNKIQRYFLKNTPIGETNLVIESKIINITKDYRNCVGNNIDEK